ncbi:MAG: YciI family protein [Bacteroidota bacterium]
MKKKQIFMMIFRYEADFNYQPTEEEKASMAEAWGSFIGNIAISEKLVSTHQLGFEGTQISADLSVTKGVHIADKQMLSGNLVVKANSLEEATDLAKGCPILEMGGTVEVRSTIPMEN